MPYTISLGQKACILAGTSLCLFLFLAVPLFANAAVMRSGETVSVPEGAVVPGDFYAAGNDVHISGVVEGDVYVLGGTVTINGTVAGDVVALGGTIAIHGSVGDDVRAFGGKVVIAESVGGDVLSAGNSIAILSTARVAGDVLFYGGGAEVSGEVVGAVHAKAESLVINSSVGSVDALLEDNLLITDGARIAGGVSYRSPEEFSRAPNAVIEGEVNRKTLAPTEDGGLAQNASFGFMMLFSSLVAILLFKERLRLMFESHASMIGLSGFLGLGVFLVTPLAASVLLVSIIGALAGVFMFMVYMGLIVVSLILMSVFVGTLIAKIIVHEYRVTWLWTIAGVLVTHALILVPVVGPILLGAVFLVMLGMVVHQTYSALRS